MKPLSIGDLATTFLRQQQNADAKRALARLTQEMTTGQVSDIGQRVRGDHSTISFIENRISSLETLETIAAETSLFTDTAQNALGVIHDLVAEAAPAFLTAANAPHDSLLRNTSSDAHSKLEAVMAKLNTSVNGKFIFSGITTDTRPLVDAGTIITDLITATAAETTAAGVIAQIDLYFDPGGGFETTAYTGSTTYLAPLQAGDGSTVDFNLTADDTSFRATLKGLALTALVDQGVLAGNIDEQAQMVRSGAETLLQAQSDLSVVQGRLGSAQAEIENASVQNRTEKAALEIERSETLSADPYKTATELEAVQVQLETLYTLTARLSRLSLVDFLR